MKRLSPFVLTSLIFFTACSSVIAPTPRDGSVAPDDARDDAVESEAPLDSPVAPVDARDEAISTDARSDDAPDALTCASPATGTFDCASHAIADEICGGVLAAHRACHVCVQTYAADGRPTRWAAIESDFACGCPAPRVETAPDASEGDAVEGDAVEGDAIERDAIDDGSVCASAGGTRDCSTRGIAQTICDGVEARGAPCHVCLQRVTQEGRALSWMAVNSPASCGCAPPWVQVYCGPAICFAPESVCVWPAVPRDCSVVDAGTCRPGCPGCFVRLAGCAPSSRSAGCAAGDCDCYVRAYCPEGVGRCMGAAETGLSIDCGGP